LAGRSLPAESNLTNRCTRRRIMVILNWFEELKQRVPTGGR
jgi:hypothetical protein